MSELVERVAKAMARAAIEALDEPTEAMCEAGIGSGACDSSDNIPARPEEVWRAMIAAALADP